MQPAELKLFRAGSARDDARAARLAELHGCEADAARGAEHYERLARLQRAAIVQGIVAARCAWCVRFNEDTSCRAACGSAHAWFRRP